MPSDLKCPAPRCGGVLDIHSADPNDPADPPGVDPATGRILSWQCESCGRVYASREQRGKSAEQRWNEREREDPRDDALSRFIRERLEGKSDE